MSRLLRRADRIRAMAALALRANLRSGLARGGLVMAVAIMLTGPLMNVTADRPWGFDAELGFYGFLILALFTLRSGHQEQRELGLDVFLRQNMANSLEHSLSSIVSVLGAWTAVCTWSFLAILVISGGDLDLASWYTASWGVRSLLLVGFVPLVEHGAAFRLPFLVPVIVYLVLVITLAVVLPEEKAVALFIPLEHGESESLARLALQAAVLLTAASTAFVLLASAEPWARRRIGRILPSRR